MCDEEVHLVFRQWSLRLDLQITKKKRYSPYSSVVSSEMFVVTNHMMLCEITLISASFSIKATFGYSYNLQARLVSQ
jgi:hypothetical protein